MKILYVLEYYYPHVGGVEVLFQKLAEGAVKRGHQVRIVTIELPGTLSSEDYNGVEIVRLWVPKIGQRYWFTFLSFFRVIWHISGFDIVHTTVYNAAWPAWLAAFFLRKRIILSVHEVWGNLWYQLSGMNYFFATLHRWFEWFILKLPFDYYITISDYTKSALEKLRKSSNKITKIYPGLDYDFFDPQKYTENEIRKKLNLDNYFIYTYFGRPGWAKGLIYLIKAVPAIKNEIKRTKLLLILSRDPLSRYQAIKKLIKDLSIEENVVILDSVPRTELPKYIKASNCVVVPSISEGFGFSVGEACVLGVPVLASHAGSIPEIIFGRYRFFEPANPEAITKAVKKAYKGEFEWSKKKEFDWSHTIDRYCEIYSEIS